MKKVSVLLGVVVAAIAASSCCILPLLLGAASVGTVGLSAALTPYRPYFIALTVLLLGVAFYFTYRPQKAGCETDCCDVKSVRTQRISRALLWVVTLFTVGALAYPNIAAYRARVSASSVPVVAAVVKAQTVLFTIPSMDCAACAVNIADTLKKTPGVYDAKVAFDTKQARVRYDAMRVGIAQLRDVIDRTGFPATQTKPGGDDCCPVKE
ncbi:MAG TPA: mercuric transporter MerT family protein [Chthonomonadaceae bacterium]|nr:mercuric transporter MerT family protein [Chthonomonadaceae bacterium]